MIQLIINNRISATTKKSPFKANHRSDANIGRILKFFLKNTKIPTTLD